MSFDPEALPIPDLGLLCLRCNYPLAGLTSHRCPECGKSFNLDEHIPPGDFPVLILAGKELSPDKTVLDLLGAYQIAFLVQPDTLGGLYGFSVSHVGRARLAVARNQYYEAINLLRLRDAGRPLPPPPVKPPGRADWSCPSCRESNPSNFEICWSCSASAPSL